MNLEHCGCIDLNALTQKGIFEGALCDIRIDERPFCSAFWADGMMELRLDGSKKVLRIDVRTVAQGYGKRRYFVCPETGRQCMKLYVLGDRIASRQALGLFYASQTVAPEAKWAARVKRLSDRLLGENGAHPAVGKIRQKVLRELAEMGRWYLFYQEVEAEVRTYARKAGITEKVDPICSPRVAPATVNLTVRVKPDVRKPRKASVAMIANALAREKGNEAQAAATLGMTRQAINRRINKEPELSRARDAIQRHVAAHREPKYRPFEYTHVITEVRIIAFIGKEIL